MSQYIDNLLKLGPAFVEFPAGNPYIGCISVDDLSQDKPDGPILANGLSLDEILRSIPRNDPFREAKIWLAMVEQQPDTNQTLTAQIQFGIEIAEKFGLGSLASTLNEILK